MHSLDVPSKVEISAENFLTSLLFAEVVPLFEMNSSHVLDQIFLQCKRLVTSPLLAAMGPDVLMDSFYMDFELVFALEVLLTIITVNKPLFQMHSFSVSFQVAFCAKPFPATRGLYLSRKPNF